MQAEILLDHDDILLQKSLVYLMTFYSFLTSCACTFVSWQRVHLDSRVNGKDKYPASFLQRENEKVDRQSFKASCLYWYQMLKKLHTFVRVQLMSNRFCLSKITAKIREREGLSKYIPCREKWSISELQSLWEIITKLLASCFPVAMFICFGESSSRKYLSNFGKIWQHISR